MQKKNQLVIGILLYWMLAGNALAQASAVIGPGVSGSVTSGRSIVVVALQPPENIVGGTGGTSAAINSIQNQVTRAVSGAREIYRFNNIPAMVIELDNMTDLNALSRNPGVRRIDLDVGGTGLLADSVPLVGATTWFLSGRIRSAIRFRRSRRRRRARHPCIWNYYLRWRGGLSWNRPGCRCGGD